MITEWVDYDIWLWICHLTFRDNFRGRDTKWINEFIKEYLWKSTTFPRRLAKFKRWKNDHSLKIIRIFLDIPTESVENVRPWSPFDDQRRWLNEEDLLSDHRSRQIVEMLSQWIVPLNKCHFQWCEFVHKIFLFHIQYALFYQMICLETRKKMEILAKNIYKSSRMNLFHRLIPSDENDEL